VVRELVSGMGRVSNGLPITVKCRLGVDDHDSYDELTHFIHTVRVAHLNVIINRRTSE
jgi:tRNA-dihydrouridine synthase A